MAMTDTPPMTSSVTGLRVVLADDSLLIRDGLEQVLTAQGVHVVGHAGTPVEAITEVRRTRPDVVILDMRMPPSYTNEGVLAAEAIRRDVPGTGILVLAQTAERAHVDRLLRGHGRAIGYLLKDRLTSWREFATALRNIADGGTAIDPVVVEMLLSGRSGGQVAQLDQLTDRERVVLALMAEGLTNRGIAERMDVSTRTVETHIQSVFAKLALRSDDSEHRRVAAVLQYLRAISEAS